MLAMPMKKSLQQLWNNSIMNVIQPQEAKMIFNGTSLSSL